MWWVLAVVITAVELRICFWIDTHYRARNAFLLGLLAMAPLAFVPPIGDALGKILRRLSEPSRRTRRLAFFAIVTVFAAWGYAQGVRSDRAPYPLLHDEHSYLLQAQHLARLRLWMPQHPLADFFESFHILVKPVYSSIYWPGTALMNVPAIWFNLPVWVIPALLYGAVLGVTYLIVTESAGGAAGVVAVLIAGSQSHLVAFAIGVMAQMPAAVLGAAMLWAWWTSM